MKKKLLLIFAILLLIIFSFIYDSSIVKYFENSRNIYLDYVFISVAFASNVFIIFFFLTSLFLWNKNKRRWIFPLWLAGLFSIAISFLLKIGFSRARPFQNEIVSISEAISYFIKENLSSWNTWNFSFPSFQAVLVFSALPILIKEFRKFSYIWFVFAFLVALSRVYFGVHYFSDILVGSLIGYCIGIITIKIEEKYRIGERIT